MCRVRGLVVGVVACASALAAFGAGSAHATASVSLSAPTATPGDEIVVRLDGWHPGVATLSTCGNAATRGSRDCDLLGAQSVKIEPDGATLYDFRVTRPPIGCPCVIRASTPAGRETALAPIALVEVPDAAPVSDASSATANGIDVAARLRVPASSWPASWFPAFAGPAPRTLVVTVENRNPAEITDLRVSAVVGRDHRSGTPVATRAVGPLAAGARRRISIPVDLPTPTFGDYVVYGDVSGGNIAEPFTTETSNDPWGLELLLPVALLLAAQVLRRRARSRRERAVVEPLPPSFQECSPEVGADAEERSPWSAYDPIAPLASADR